MPRRSGPPGRPQRPPPGPPGGARPTPGPVSSLPHLRGHVPPPVLVSSGLSGFARSSMARAQARLCSQPAMSCALLPAAGPRCRRPRRIPACPLSQARPGPQPGSRCARPRRPEIFSRAAAPRSGPAPPAQFLPLPAGKHLGRPGPPGCPPALLRLRSLRRRNTPRTRTPPPGTTRRREHDMDAAATSASAAITCTKPGCGARTIVAESVYIDGCGQVCPPLRRPGPAWLHDIEAPY
jgi:hypothetical protein